MQRSSTTSQLLSVPFENISFHHTFYKNFPFVYMPWLAAMKWTKKWKLLHDIGWTSINLLDASCILVLPSPQLAALSAQRSKAAQNLFQIPANIKCMQCNGCMYTFNGFTEVVVWIWEGRQKRSWLWGRRQMLFLVWSFLVQGGKGGRLQSVSWEYSGFVEIFAWFEGVHLKLSHSI